MWCSLGVLPEWKRPVVDCPLMLVTVFYVVEYFFDGEFWLPKLCRRTSVYLWRVLGVTGHELRSVLAMFCGLDLRGDGRLLGCTWSGGMKATPHSTTIETAHVHHLITHHPTPTKNATKIS
jgi:hypothetical protein